MVTFIASKLAVAGIISTVGLSMFPFILAELDRSQIQPDGVGLGDGATPRLFNMLVATLIFLPIVLAYTAWVTACCGARWTRPPSSKTTRRSIEPEKGASNVAAWMLACSLARASLCSTPCG